MVQKAKKIWFDGKLVNWDDAQVHVLAHTLHYGVGVFEGIRCYKTEDGKSAVFRMNEHVDRLFDSAHIVLIDIPFTREEIRAAIHKTLIANELSEGYIRPIVFLGEGEMGLYVRTNPVRVAIATWPWGAYLGEDGLKKGIRAKTSSFNRHHPNAAMTKGKVIGNYVNSVLAKWEVMKAGYDEAVLLDTEGYVAEGSGENIFIVRNGILQTTPLTSVLPGITRDSVITIAQKFDIPVKEARFTRDEMYIADEMFYTGTAAEITPVREVDDRKVGAGKPGPVTKRIQAAFFDILRGKNALFQHWLDVVK
ncbi:MAG TPA: branched chain amino acid aminotransferase [Deltaproteobacteria bacterium]|nr:MAG: branched chain amino acid aminotransferase [Deltaproteobacteria bacterium GWA2_65_63]OGP27059.1 MAG: branched chain amino acid aminotransferase [Deltaproteobacteria bacterium GWB2_65_81]OGP40088.1 MAG: branched chain amino acid aminotransferase [Deltaproteobacteria bacterium GWC2_66_88]OGP79218.1 MAG: branched chain amino acid aminotransferase [Deltaproteobacteria bacterium RBG_16_66_15]HAM33217.1 branched chain amino acid aminotransferase [Deltaproteobacteria bacterium]